MQKQKPFEFVQFTVILRIKQGVAPEMHKAIPVPGAERDSSPSGSQKETLKLGKEHMGILWAISESFL